MISAKSIATKTNGILSVEYCEPMTESLSNDRADDLVNVKKIKDAAEFNAETKLYMRRWLQLGLFVIYAAANSMQWIQFTIVGNIISRYYGVSSLAVDWTSLIFHVMYLIVLLPASYVMSRIGLRWTCLVGAIGTSIGSWIKFFSVAQDRFVWLLIGQAIVGACQVFVLTGPARLAANWFGPNEVATATSIGFFGVLGGISGFFLIVPMVIRNHENMEEIKAELSYVSSTVAVLCTTITIALYFFFKEEPPLPPSEATALAKIKRRFEGKVFWPTVKKILTNRSFVMIWNSSGINAGYLNVVSTLLNPMYLAHFQNGEMDAGNLGLLMNLPGNFGSIIFSIILDKTRCFKSLEIFIHVSSLVGQILFATGLIMEIKWLVFLAIIVIGVFAISCGNLSYELSAETTYPEPEEVSAGLLSLAQQVYGTILVLIVGAVLRTYGDKVAHSFLAVILTFALLLAILTKNDLRRQNARKEIFRNADPLLALVEPRKV